MKLEISKEMIEKHLGFEINDFKLEPMFENGKCICFEIFASPKMWIQYINIDFTISPTSVNFLDK